MSVIVVCRNPGPRLADALGSALDQTAAADLELVVVDGASTDGTRPWLQARRAAFGTLISEPDAGVYDAMNKGVAAARGDWLLFLGADDRFAAPTVIAQVVPLLRGTSAAVAVGEARFDDGRVYRLAPPRAAIRRNFVHHQAAFYRRSCFAQHGGFDTALRLQADYEFNLRLLRAGERFAALPVRIAECASGGLSDAGRWENYREEIAVRRRHFGLVRACIWDAASVVRFLRKQLLRRPHG